MISWWWLLIVAPVAGGIGYFLAIRAVMRGFKRSLEDPSSPVRKYIDPCLEALGRSTFETAAQVAEAHQMVKKCPQNCGTTIAQGMRETAIKQSLKGV